MKDLMEHKAPIQFQAVYPKSLSFTLHQMPQKKVLPKQEIKVGIMCNKTFEDNERKAIVTLSVEIPSQKSKLPFELNFTYEGIFTIREDTPVEELKKFVEHNAPALLFPYIRAEISHITGSTGLPALNLPPINLYGALSEKKTIGKEQARTK